MMVATVTDAKKVTAVKTQTLDAKEIAASKKVEKAAKKGTGNKRDNPKKVAPATVMTVVRPSLKKRKGIAVDAKPSVVCPNDGFKITLGPDSTEADCPKCGEELTLEDNSPSLEGVRGGLSVEEKRDAETAKHAGEEPSDENLDEVG